MQVAAGEDNQITVESWSGANFAADKGAMKPVTGGGITPDDAVVH